MLRDPLCCRATAQRTPAAPGRRRGRAGEGDPALRKLGLLLRVERFTALATLFAPSMAMCWAFGALQEAGCLDVITTCATHGYLPVVRDPTARRAQIAVAMRAYRGWFAASARAVVARGGYADGVDGLLAEHDLRYFFTDAHGLLYARPRPPLRAARADFTPAGVAAFARDLDSSRSVWSATEGYPADPVYRDFYRDIGLRSSAVGDCPLHPSRRHPRQHGLLVPPRHRIARRSRRQGAVRPRHRPRPRRSTPVTSLRSVARSSRPWPSAWIVVPSWCRRTTPSSSATGGLKGPSSCAACSVV